MLAPPQAETACASRDTVATRPGSGRLGGARGWLERDVVVGPAAGRRRREVPGVGGDVALRREAAAVAGALLAAAEELDGVGDDVYGLALVAFLVLPLAPLEATVDRHGAALLEVGGAVLALRAPHRDVEVIGLVDPLARCVLAARVAGDAEAAD